LKRYILKRGLSSMLEKVTHMSVSSLSCRSIYQAQLTSEELRHWW
jgi:hypothetical protein